MVVDFSFYLTGFDDIFGESCPASLVPHRHAGIGQTSHQNSLGAADRRNRFCERSKIKLPVWPIMGLPDVLVITAFHVVIMSLILHICSIFSAKNAVFIGIIRGVLDQVMTFALLRAKNSQPGHGMPTAARNQAVSLQTR